MTAIETLLPLCHQLRLPEMRRCLEPTLEQAAREGWSHARFVRALLEAECEARGLRRIERLRQASDLPMSKVKETLELGHLPAKVQRQLPRLFEGAFVEAKHNVLLFGKPGVGKTHVASAIGHALIEAGHSVWFAPAQKLVQRLLRAKQSLELERMLDKLDRIACVIIDDIGYVQQSREEMEVLFTFLAERYERRSVIITSNLVFSQWDAIFKDPMTTAAAIDRLIHHCVLLELSNDSYRKRQAQNQTTSQTKP